jgi:anti-sigma B factor antagonist
MDLKANTGSLREDSAQPGRGPLADHLSISCRCSANLDPRPRLLVRALGGLTVVDFLNTPSFLEGCMVRDLGERLQSLVNQGHKRILLNLAGVESASSSALSSLQSLHRQVSQAHGCLILCGIDPILRDALRICHLDSELEIYRNESEARVATKGARDRLALPESVRASETR